jgi:hypothetical protein
MLSKGVRPFVFYVVIFVLLCNSSAISQDKDAQLWTSLSIEAKLVKKLTANVSQELRFNENITEAGTIYSDFGLEYKINKYFQVAVNYRFVEKRRRDNNYSYRHRMYVDIKFEKKLKPMKIQVRSRIQDEYANIGRESEGGIAEYYLRNKFSLKWDTEKPITPYLSVELFSPLKSRYYGAFDNIRAATGVEYAFSKHHKIDIFYMIQKEINVSRPETDFVMGLGYSFKL